MPTEQPLSVVAGRALTLMQIKRLQGAARKSAGLFSVHLRRFWSFLAWQLLAVAPQQAVSLPGLPLWLEHHR